MRTGSCKYGSNCRFHHPEPVTVGGDSPSGYRNGGSFPSQFVSSSSASSWSSPRAFNETSPFVPAMFPPSQGAPTSHQDWNGYKVNFFLLCHYCMFMFQLSILLVIFQISLPSTALISFLWEDIWILVRIALLLMLRNCKISMFLCVYVCSLYLIVSNWSLVLISKTHVWVGWEIRCS